MDNEDEDMVEATKGDEELEEERTNNERRTSTTTTTAAIFPTKIVMLFTFFHRIPPSPRRLSSFYFIQTMTFSLPFTSYLLFF